LRTFSRALTIFSERLQIDWSACPADLAILEQVTLARNQSQHSETLTSLEARHPRNFRAQFPNPLFIPEHERQWTEEERAAFGMDWWGSELTITRDTLFEAIKVAEQFVDWLEPQLQTKRWG